MSRQLVLSSALSVLMMSAFALFGPHARGEPTHGEAFAAPVSIAAPALPDPARLLPVPR